MTLRGMGENVPFGLSVLESVFFRLSGPAMNAGIGLATWRHRKGSPCWIYKTFETIKLEIFEILSGVLWVHEGQSDKMPNEGRKEYLKILGVDNCSSESRFYHGYHALCNYGVYASSPPLPTWKWPVESEFLVELKAWLPQIPSSSYLSHIIILWNKVFSCLINNRGLFLQMKLRELTRNSHYNVTRTR